MRYRLGDFQFDVTQQRLIGPRGPVELRRMSLRVLQVLIERAPAVVAKDALIDAVWGHAALSASSLPQTIKELRQALGDDPDAPRYIATRHRHGYQWLMPVETAEPDASPARDIERDPTVAPTSRWSRWIAATLVVAIAAAATAFAARWRVHAPNAEAVSPPAAAITLRLGTVDANGVEDATVERLRNMLLLKFERAGIAVQPASTTDASAELRLHLANGGTSGLRAAMRVIRVDDGREIASREDAALPDELEALADRLVHSAAMILAVDVRADDNAAEDRGVPRKGPALDLYLDARTAMKAGRILDARRLLQESRALDGSAPNPHFLYARIALTLGEVGEAKAAIIAAAEAAAPSAHRKQLMIEATRREIEFGPGRALPVYRALADVNAEDGNSIGLCLDAAIDAGDWPLAETMLRRARDTQAFSPLSLDLSEAELAKHRGDAVAQLAAMRRAVERLPGSHHCCPDSVQLGLARAERANRRYDDAARRIATVIDHADAAHDGRLRAQALLERAQWHDEAHGDAEAMARDLVAAQTGFADLGDRRGETDALTERAEFALAHDDPALASTLYRALETLADERGDPDDLVLARIGLARALSRLGQADTALERQQAALSLARSRGNPRLVEAAEQALIPTATR